MIIKKFDKTLLGGGRIKILIKGVVDKIKY